MNRDEIKGNWKQFAGKAKEKWGKLTDDDWTLVAGKRNQLVGRVQQRYGIARDEAEKQVSEFERSYESV
ncbi:MAG TPA: CsbD family protein [Stellaceae bacterium]|nr:CsbD family protein [Stellaceae bacterium]